MKDDIVALHRKSGYSPIEAFRDPLTRIRDSLEEVKRATTVEHMETAAKQAQACFCAATGCDQGCPLDKKVPSIMEQLREVDFELINREFADVQEQLDTYMEDYRDKSFEEYFTEARKGYVRKVNQLISEKPELNQELDKLKSAYMTQVSRIRSGDETGLAKNPFPEFTGMLCPAPCESGGPEGPGCTLKESGKHEPVRIRSTEYDLASIGFALGWTDEIFRLPASMEQTRARHGLTGDETVAIVGAGPAGLQAAYRLAMKGLKVTLFDKDDEIGGQMYRGIPDHKFEKERLVKYRLLLQQMGVEIKLGPEAEVTPEQLEAYDATMLAVGVMDGQVEPTWVEGYADAKEAGLTQDAYGFLRGGNEWVSEGNNEAHEAVPQGKQTIMVYGDGYTATDAVQTLARMKAQNNPDLTVIHAFRDTGVNDNVAGGFSIAESRDDYQTHAFSTLKEDKKSASIATFPGANIAKIETTGDLAKVHFEFQKPKEGFGKVARQVRKDNRGTERDSEAGGIYADGQLVGVRLRDANGQLKDYAHKEGVQFEIEPSAAPIAGDVKGTLSLEFNKIIPAMGAKDASKNLLVQAMGINAEPYKNKGDQQNKEGIWNGVSMSHPGVFMIGDAGTHLETNRDSKDYGQNVMNDQLIVSAQASANKAVDRVVRFLNQKRAAQETEGAAVDMASIAAMSELGGAMERAA